MRTHAPMTLRSGLTYIIINKKTKLALNNPASEGGFVTVDRLSEDDTQKVQRSVFCHNLPV